MGKHLKVPLNNKTLLFVLLAGIAVYVVYAKQDQFREYFNNSADYGVLAYSKYGAPLGFSNASPDLLRNPPLSLGNRGPYYPNLRLPSNVIGGGYRNGPLMGGSQIGIPNVLPPVDISNRNIAPSNLINIPTSFPINLPSTQIGAMYNVMGESNDVHPLYGRRTDRNRWEYHTIINGVRVPVQADRRYDIELGNNDKVRMNGHEFRVTKYDSSLQYSL